MNILIDSSVWIDYFRGGENSGILDSLIDEDFVCTNDLILSELLPALRHNGQLEIAELLQQVTRIPLVINWENIIEYQTLCLSKGINKVGIPDLIIVDNVIQNDLVLYSFDKHFNIMNTHLSFRLFEID